MKTNNRKLSVTADSGANQKLLRELERQGHITLTVVNLENGKQNKVRDKIGPVGVWGKHNWGDGSVWESEDNNKYKQILSVVGAPHYQDARQLEAHYRRGNDIFVTEDGDILSKKEDLFKQPGIRVMSPEELKSLFAQ